MNKQENFGDFIKHYDLVIPDYQRAYSWDEKQLVPFINDLLEHCDQDDNPDNDPAYYLGHYILEKSKVENYYEIVDGQQRITTIYLFLLLCGHIDKADYVDGINFKTVSFDSDILVKIKEVLKFSEPIEEALLNLRNDCETLSAKRMIDAVLLFRNSFYNEKQSGKTLEVENIKKYKEF